MKTLYTLLIVLLLAQNSYAQKIIFFYNEAGLRVKRGEENALPVTLISFTAGKLQKEMRIVNALKWKTSSEQDSERFDIERSPDAKSWVTLASLPAKGDSEIEEQYVYDDEVPLNGDNYYRLKMIDRDGRFAHSLVRHLFAEELLSLYPNPVEDILYIRGGEPSEIQIFNVLGQAMLNTQAVSSEGIDVSRLPTGTYILQSKQPGHEWVTRKFIKK